MLKKKKIELKAISRDQRKIVKILKDIDTNIF